MRETNVRILIADDHELIREGLRRILIEGKVAGHVGEATTAAEAVASARAERWDLVILDINLAGASGLDVLKDLRAEHPRLPILMLSMYPEEQFALRVMRAGASGYLNKNQAARALVEAIRLVLSGSHYISEKVASQLLNAATQTDGREPHNLLSDREYQVLRLIATGLAVGEIATRLGLSVKTVSTYRGKILAKLQLRNNAQLMRYAYERGLND